MSKENEFDRQPWQIELVTYLHQNFAQLKQKNHRYSLRAYAKKLSISPSGLSELMGKTKRWTLSPVRGARLLAKLDMSRSKRNQILVAMKEKPQHDTHVLSNPEHEIFLDWTHLPILFSFDLPKPFHRPQNIAKRLGISVIKVRATIDHFVECGFLVRKSGASLFRPQVFIKSTDGIPSAIVRQGHVVNFDLNKRALEELPMERRDFTSLTFAGSEKKLEFLRQQIRALHHKASTIIDDGDNNDQIFKLNIQLFPTEFK